MWAELLEPAPDIDSPEFANFYWFGVPSDKNHPTSLALIPDLFKYCLWKFKLKRKVPSPTAMKVESSQLPAENCGTVLKI